jgi:hypothetical protein
MNDWKTRQNFRSACQNFEPENHKGLQFYKALIIIRTTGDYTYDAVLVFHRCSHIYSY